LRALPRNDVGVWSAPVNPDWTPAFHPEPAFLMGYAAFVDNAGAEVTLVQNERCDRLRHALSVLIFVRGVKSCQQTIDS
jgi:hypothetical protein